MLVLNRTIVVLSCLCVFVLSVVVCHGSVIYEFVEAGSGNILGELRFLDSVAKDDGPWTVPADVYLLSLLEDARWVYLSFLWQFSFDDYAQSGIEDFGMVLGLPFGSDSGSSLDFGLIKGSVAHMRGGVLFPGGLLDFLTFDSAIGSDVVSGLDRSQPGGGWGGYSRVGDWVLHTEQTPIPEPTTIVLMSCGLLGLLGICIKRRRRKAR